MQHSTELRMIRIYKFTSIGWKVFNIHGSKKTWRTKSVVPTPQPTKKKYDFDSHYIPILYQGRAQQPTSKKLANLVHFARMIRLDFFFFFFLV